MKLSPFITVKRPLLYSLQQNFGFILFDEDLILTQSQIQMEPPMRYNSQLSVLKMGLDNIRAQNIQPNQALLLWSLILGLAVPSLDVDFLFGLRSSPFAWKRPSWVARTLLCTLEATGQENGDLDYLQTKPFNMSYIHSMPYQISFLNRLMQQFNS